jgi:hypothetical protein
MATNFIRNHRLNSKEAIAILVQKCLNAQGKDAAIWEAEIAATLAVTAPQRVGRLYALPGNETNLSRLNKGILVETIHRELYV